jgi:hypothetical protein
VQALIAGAVLVLAACAVLAVAGVCCLAKWDGRRYRMLARPRAAQLAAAPIPQTASPADRGPRPTVTRLWLCQACYWTWPAADLFCGVCGRSRAVASDGRDIQSLSEGR